MENLNFFNYSLVNNAYSFTFATMMAATLFFWLNLRSVAPSYRPALVITGLVTMIASYHYMQILFSFNDAFVANGTDVVSTGKIFNVAYRYVDWLLTVPLLLIELVLVMKLSKAETFRRATTLGFAAALMIILGYPGEVAGDMGTRFVWWVLSMVPFLYIVFTLFGGLSSAIDNQPKEAKNLVNLARWVVLVSWSFYPIVYLLPYLGVNSAFTVLEIGYSISDIIAKAGFGVLIYLIARAKSESENYVAS